jgi:GntR family transcriptional repressor for pyruvate dehydrogenase complex
MQAIQSVRLYEQVASALRKQIVAGELKVGQRLPTEREIAERYCVSRNVVREAIRALTNDGLVIVRQGSGTYVADGTSKALGDSLELAISLGDVADKFLRLIEIRQLIEPGVAALAAEHATPADIEALRREVDIMHSALTDVDTFIAADQRFHVAIAKASGNYLVPLMLNPIVDVLDEQRKKLFFIEDSPTAAQDFHRLILSKIEKHDARGAFAAMRAHLEQVRTDVERLLRPAEKALSNLRVAERSPLTRKKPSRR